MRSYEYYKGGKRHYERDLDVTNLLRTIHRVEFMYNLFLNKDAQDLERMSKYYLISTHHHEQGLFEQKKK